MKLIVLWADSNPYYQNIPFEQTGDLLGTLNEMKSSYQSYSKQLPNIAAINLKNNVNTILLKQKILIPERYEYVTKFRYEL